MQSIIKFANPGVIVSEILLYHIMFDLLISRLNPGQMGFIKFIFTSQITKRGSQTWSKATKRKSSPGLHRRRTTLLRWMDSRRKDSRRMGHTSEFGRRSGVWRLLQEQSNPWIRQAHLRGWSCARGSMGEWHAQWWGQNNRTRWHSLHWHVRQSSETRKRYVISFALSFKDNLTLSFFPFH